MKRADWSTRDSLLVENHAVRSETLLLSLCEEYERLVTQDLDWRIRRVLGSNSGPWGVVSGKKALILCSNNYLNLTNHPKVKKAALDTIEKYGAGSGQSGQLLEP